MKIVSSRFVRFLSKVFVVCVCAFKVFLNCLWLRTFVRGGGSSNDFSGQADNFGLGFCCECKDFSALIYLALSINLEIFTVYQKFMKCVCFHSQRSNSVAYYLPVSSRG